MITCIMKDLIWFEYKGDEVAWDGKHYISLLSEGTFDSLEDLDSFWENCYNSMQERNMMQVTRDMAMDAGDLSLEGQIWQW